MSSLTDTEYDEIFSLAINRAVTEGTPSPAMEYDTGNSDVENEIEVKLQCLSQTNKKHHQLKLEQFLV
jgi:hypothetical protein